MGFEDEALNAHNKYRAMHGAPPLTLNKDLCTMSKKWADHLAKTGKFEHSPSNMSKYKGAPVGENLAGGSGMNMTGNAEKKSSKYKSLNKCNMLQRILIRSLYIP